MNLYLQLVCFIGLYLLLHYQITDCSLRKRFAVTFIITGLVLLFWLPYVAIILNIQLLPLALFLIGLALFITRNKYRLKRNRPPHPLLRAPTMNLAPHFPEDPVMQQLLQLLHEEIGLPQHKTIRLQTSLNFDLACDGVEAKQFMEALEQDFGVDLSDYDAYRYFQPPMFDVFLKRRAKGRGDKIPLTIGMLYLAIKTQRWDTQTLENLS
jgi:acyl carrier protein